MPKFDASTKVAASTWAYCPSVLPRAAPTSSTTVFHEPSDNPTGRSVASCAAQSTGVVSVLDTTAVLVFKREWATSEFESTWNGKAADWPGGSTLGGRGSPVLTPKSGLTISAVVPNFLPPGTATTSFRVAVRRMTGTTTSVPPVLVS